jgi:hypothetical protein
VDRQRYIREPDHHRGHPAGIRRLRHGRAADSDEERERRDLAVSALLSEHSPGQRWWLGYLDTGVDDIVFPGAPMVTLYSGWHYVLVEAGPEQAVTWRRNDPGSYGVLPNLMFPPIDRGSFHAVGRRLELHRRTRRTRGQIPAPR